MTDVSDRMVEVLEDSAGVASSLMVDALAALGWLRTAKLPDGAPDLDLAEQSILSALQELGMPEWAAKELAMNRAPEQM